MPEFTANLKCYLNKQFMSNRNCTFLPVSYTENSYSGELLVKETLNLHFHNLYFHKALLLNKVKTLVLLAQ